ncbi:MAG: UvrD-helicase domain-containing protein [Alphaproteobacteria bacterium]|nr:UvrD-helicase domain-containing protein [Alphaproteobacteria bacterium]MCB9796676.1 UvrD-helicase domain-containing protein [Alphaproteobacteria bacterium]
MRFYADLHVHSKHSRATSKQADLEHHALWGLRKGLTLVGTGDFTHPAWRAELGEKLVEAEPGLYRLRPDLERALRARLPGALHAPLRFALQVEISTIYKKGDKTRKVHHCVYAPDLEAVDRINTALGRIGNLKSDGRPILGLDSRDLLEIVLEAGEGCALIPAHVWTPWFAALGSKSGFDTIDACYGDLAEHVFAIETGLSSDPAMNWRIPSLDRFRLVSHSDAHSPSKLAREATLYDTDLSWWSVLHALRTGEGYVGTVEFFPEEGKYHLDGHRACGVRQDPTQTRAGEGICPACGRGLTIGTMHRIEDLAGRPEGAPPPDTAGEVHSLVPLPEMIAELHRVGPDSKRVTRDYERLLAELGPELFILEQVELEQVRRAGAPLLALALERLRAGEVRRDPGYDGEYGRIHLFEEGELDRLGAQAQLFTGLLTLAPPPAPPRAPSEAPQEPRRLAVAQGPASPRPEGASLLDGLDPEQRAAAEVREGPLLVTAGPGSGKTRTLTHRLAWLIAEQGVAPESCLAITFTRRAAQEMAERLEALLPGRGEKVRVTTFHGLALSLLLEHAEAAGLPEDARLADEAERAALLAQALEVSEAKARRLLARLSQARLQGDFGEPFGELDVAWLAYRAAMDAQHLLDFDDLVPRCVALLEQHVSIRDSLRDMFQHVSVDELQDINAPQYRLIQLLCPPDGSLYAIGDPDQAIYAFRGSDLRFFRRFTQDWPGARVLRLSRNYRSGQRIVAAARQLITAADARPRDMRAMPGHDLHVCLHAAATERAEAEFVVHGIEKLMGGYGYFSVDSGRVASGEGCDLSFSDIAVLYRTAAQAGALREALDRSGVPYQQHGHEALGEHPGVAALLAAMGEGPPLEALAEAAERAEVQGLTLQQGLELLRPLAQPSQDLAELRSRVALTSSVDLWDPRAHRVSLLTLHASKGLEFRAVFIVGCEDGLLPLRFGGRDQDLEEERRLFYVGLTRAKERLTLSRARSRLWRGQVQELPPSAFLADIDPSLLEEISASRARKRAPEVQGAQLAMF